MRFEVDLARVKRGWNVFPVVAGAAGVAGVTVAGVLAPGWELLAAPGAVALASGAYAGARVGYRGSVRRNVTVIERFLDLLQFGR